MTNEVLVAIIVFAGTTLTSVATIVSIGVKNWLERKAKLREEKREAIEEYSELLYRIYIEKDHGPDMRNRYQASRKLVISRVNKSTLEAIAYLEDGGNTYNFDRVVKKLRKEMGLKTGKVPHGGF